MKKAVHQRYKKYACLILNFNFIFLLGMAQQSYGQLVTVNSSNNLVYKKYANTGQTNLVNQVPDFSTCGYLGGGVAIPTVAVAETLNPASGDDQARIQAAINRISALPLQSNGFRGALLLTKGTYEVAGTLNINASGVVLRGEGQGSDGTKIIATGTVQRTLVSVAGSGSATEVSGTRKTITDSYVPVGARSFAISSASGLSVGSKIMVQFTPNNQWITDLDMAQYGWTAAEYKINYERVITAISGNTITINAPVVQAMETKYGGGSIYVYTFSGRIQKSAVESIRLESAFASDTDENHGWDAVKFSNIENGWARQVTAQYFGYSCVYAGPGSKSLTVEECAMLDPKSKIEGSRRYSFIIDGGQFMLFQRCYTRGGRHDYVTQHRVPGPNAFVDCSSTNAKNAIGPHHRYATGVLFDNIKGEVSLNNPARFEVNNRKDYGTGHGWAGAQTMFWNSYGDFIVESPIGALNYGIGCTGVKAGPGYWESFGTRVSPRSLYLKQLEERLGTTAVNNIAAPQQLSGTIWTALTAWAGEGKLFASGGGGTTYTVDNTDAGFSTTGTWTVSTSSSQRYGINYLHDGDAIESPGDGAKWMSPITTTGRYDVYMIWAAQTDRPVDAPVEINYDGGVFNRVVNQRLNGGTWYKLGTWQFTGGSGDYVSISGSASGNTIADAVRWVPEGGAVGGLSVDQTTEGLSFLKGEDTNSNGLLMFPNPASASVNLKFDTEAAGNATVEMYSSLGQKVITVNKSVSAGTNTLKVDLNEISTPGVYYIKVMLGDKIMNQQLIVNK